MWCRLATVIRLAWSYSCVVPLWIPRVSRNRTVALLRLTRIQALLSILQDVLEVREM